MANPVVAHDENAVVGFVCQWLKGQGYTIKQQLTTSQKGVDIIAARDFGEAWFIEAKGGSSARSGSPRHLQGFTANQLVDRVMKGFYTAAALAEAPECKGAKIGLAMPRSVTAERYVDKVKIAMSTLGISMIWVEVNGTVTLEKISS